MLAKYDVILIGLSRWDNLLNSSVLNLAAEWAKTHRVFYIDRPFSYKDYFISREKGALKRRRALLFGKEKYQKVRLHNQEITVVTPPLSLPINKLPEGAMYNFFHAYNNQLVSKLVKQLIVDFDIKNYVFFNSFIPEYFNIIPPNGVKPILKIYRSSDDISQEPYIAKHGVKKEQEAALAADLVLVSSYGLKYKLSQICEPIYRVPNAARYEQFCGERKFEKPAELEGANGRIIFLSGNISKLRIDYGLLALLSDKFTDDTLIIAGPYNLQEIEQFGLKNRSNMKWLGPVGLEKIASLMAFSDCAIIPFLVNTLTESIYPLKVNEYLAAGLPVVSSNFSLDIAAFCPDIYLASNQNDFIQKVGLALSEGNDLGIKKRRQEVAKENNWEARMQEILSLVDQKIIERQLG
jgi:glycosyltransferase involved in cell wall biosynthesis